jgi:hypothetical protein
MSLIDGTTLAGQWTYSLPAFSNLSTIHYYIEAMDVVGGDARMPFEGNYSITIVDLNPPLVSHVTVTEAPAGSEMTIRAEVTDDLEVGNVLLYYKPVGAENFNPPVEMLRNGDEYTAEIPAGDMTGDLQYFIRATDTYGNEHLSPQAGGSAPHVVNIYRDQSLYFVFAIQIAALVLTMWQRYRTRKFEIYEV